MTTMPDTTDTGAPDAPPVPLSQGTYALYEHNGGFMLTYRTLTSDPGEPRTFSESQHLEVPAFIVKMGRQMAGQAGGPPSGPAGFLSALMGGNTPS
jgi:hypothetical protein